MEGKYLTFVMKTSFSNKQVCINILGITGISVGKNGHSNEYIRGICM